MFSSKLTRAIEDYSNLMATVADDELELPWHWKGYDEGIRFSFFVTLLELRQLAVTLTAGRPATTPAQHILAQYHAAYLDLQAALIGIPLADADRPPSQVDWSIRAVLAHIVGGELGFTGVIRYALEGHRAGTWKANPMSEEDETRLTGLNEGEYRALMESPFGELLAFHRKYHLQLVDEFSGISSEELELPSVFWEKTHFPIGYRLHRYEAHLRQHTVQIDKTLLAIGLAPSEAKRLIRQIYHALAEVDAALIGAPKTRSVALNALAGEIVERTRKIAELLKT